MARKGILLASVVVVATVGTGVASAEDESKELRDLVIRLKLTDRGIGAWRERLDVRPGGQAAERLMIVNESGDILAERSGGASLVVIDRDSTTSCGMRAGGWSWFTTIRRALV